MFTVKHFRINGEHRVHSCDSYVVSPPGPQAQGEDIHAMRIALFDPIPRGDDSPHASKACIFVDEGEAAYIENSGGHTIDVVRLTKLHTD